MVEKSSILKNRLLVRVYFGTTAILGRAIWAMHQSKFKTHVPFIAAVLFLGLYPKEMI